MINVIDPKSIQLFLKFKDIEINRTDGLVYKNKNISDFMTIAYDLSQREEAFIYMAGPTKL